MDRNVVITSDSTCDLSPELCERYGIVKIGLWVVLGDEMVRDEDGATSVFTAYDFYEKTGTLAKTSAISVAEYKEFFERFTSQGKEVVHISISSEVSSSHQNAVIAATELQNVYVVDSRHLSSGQGLLAIKCAELANEGKNGAEIKAEADEYKNRISTSFVLETLKYMAEGGRCSTIAFYGAALMKIKPTIVMPDGKLVVGKKYRGKLSTVLKEYITDTLSTDREYELDRAFITTAGFEDAALLEELKEYAHSLVPFKEIFVTQAGITVAAHCGMNTLGILFVTK